MKVAVRVSFTFTYNKCQRVALWMQQLLHICRPMNHNPMHVRHYFLCLIALPWNQHCWVTWGHGNKSEQRRRKGKKVDKSRTKDVEGSPLPRKYRSTHGFIDLIPITTPISLLSLWDKSEHLFFPVCSLHHPGVQVPTAVILSIVFWHDPKCCMCSIICF